MKVKILLEDNQTIEEAEELLEKALSNDHKHEFLDPAMEKVFQEITILYSKQFQKMIKDIEEVLNAS